MEMWLMLYFTSYPKHFYQLTMNLFLILKRNSLLKLIFFNKSDLYCFVLSTIYTFVQMIPYYVVLSL